jgi:hypothetical protein
MFVTSYGVVFDFIFDQGLMDHLLVVELLLGRIIGSHSLGPGFINFFSLVLEAQFPGVSQRRLP